MLLVRRFYPKRLTYSVLWAIPTGVIWGEVSCPGTQRHADCNGVWTCDPLVPIPRLCPLRHTPPMLPSVCLPRPLSVCLSSWQLITIKAPQRLVSIRKEQGDKLTKHQLLVHITLCMGCVCVLYTGKQFGIYSYHLFDLNKIPFLK